jgi:arsenical pump membrane protein
VLLAVAALAGAAVAGVPLGAVSLAFGVPLVTVGVVTGDVTADHRRHITPGLLVFVSALLLLVESISRAGLVDGLGDVVGALGGQPAFIAILGAAAIGALLSNPMNNWPAALLLTAVIAAAPGHHEPLIVGTLIGCAIGANFTVVGSLSTVFWLSLARARGGLYTPGQYARAAFLPTLAAVVAASSVAALVGR